MSQASRGRPKTEAADFAGFPLRLPRALFDGIREQAREDGKPMNTHIIALLQYAMQQYHPSSLGEPSRSRRKPQPVTAS